MHVISEGLIRSLTRGDRILWNVLKSREVGALSDVVKQIVAVDVCYKEVLQCWIGGESHGRVRELSRDEALDGHERVGADEIWEVVEPKAVFVVASEGSERWKVHLVLGTKQCKALKVLQDRSVVAWWSGVLEPAAGERRASTIGSVLRGVASAELFEIGLLVNDDACMIGANRVDPVLAFGTGDLSNPGIRRLTDRVNGSVGVEHEVRPCSEEWGVRVVDGGCGRQGRRDGMLMERRRWDRGGVASLGRKRSGGQLGFKGIDSQFLGMKLREKAFDVPGGFVLLFRGGGLGSLVGLLELGRVGLLGLERVGLLELERVGLECVGLRRVRLFGLERVLGSRRFIRQREICIDGTPLKEFLFLDGFKVSQHLLFGISFLAGFEVFSQLSVDSLMNRFRGEGDVPTVVCCRRGL
jgi:hypothetical protein